ncbi:Virus X resistance protein-like, coiled-coil domain [Sesbania bispinosa]|nr:Virus X resistance protein-like, coiled-coil domain [Sesbania bispinosa]
MADVAVLFALEQVFQLLKEETNLLRGVHKDFSDIKDELESIQALLKDADRRAGDEADTNDGIRTWVKQLRKVSFRIEDVIDEYLWVMRGANHPPCLPLSGKIGTLIRTLIPRHQIASKIQDVKLTVRGIKERSERYNFQGSSSSSTRATEDGRWRDPRLASLFIEESEIVGFEFPRDELHVFDNQKVTGHFDCRAFITVSQSYTIRGILIDMMEQFCKETQEPLPQMLHKMDEKSLITEVRQYLLHKSRIIITTRIMHVAEFFKKSFLVHIHTLQLLPPDKAFRFEFDGHCPPELEAMSNEIVQKCKGLPLAIVAIGGLFSTKSKTVFEWQTVSQNLRLELERNAHLTSLTKILSLSYDDLPYYLKPRILYFGIYPEDYSINHKRLTRQWIAEGFVKSEKRRTLEQVAEEYLSELIHRSLVQVSEICVDGKVKICQVHDLLREVIIRKMKDLSFCHHVHEDDQSAIVGVTRRLSIVASSNNVLKSTRNTHIHAIHVFEKGTSLNYVPNNLGILFHLRYINLRNTKVQALPKSIGMLQNLETLDLRETLVHQLPSEINKLIKLCHLLVFHRNYEADYSIFGFTTGALMEKGIKNLTSLQNLYYVEVDHGGIDLIQEMRMLRQLRKLGLRHVKREYGNAICASVAEMKHLESLSITAIAEDEMVDLNFISSPLQLRRLHLKARLEKLPDWIPKLEYLLSMCDDAYDGEILHFQHGGFPKLKELDLRRLNRVCSILIDKGSLLSLQKFMFNKIPQLKAVPSGVKDLDNPKIIDILDMPADFVESIDPDNGENYWIIKNVPLVFIRHWIGPKLFDHEIRTIQSSSMQS